MSSTRQYPRAISLIVFNNSLDGIDLSQLRIKFSTKSSDSMTPNTADIRIYNLEPNTALKIKKEFKGVILQGGYEGNKGVIFKGNIKQVIIGRESATDTFIDIVAGDGDRAYNFAIVTQSLASPSQADQIAAASNAMAGKGVTQGHIGDTVPGNLPRGKVMFGPARDYLKNAADNSDSNWFIQNEKITFVKKTTYLPSQVVVLNSNTGMVGSPQQTNVGVNVKNLINPRIAPGTRVQIDNASIQALKINLEVKTTKEIAKSIAPSLTADGVYYVLVMEHTGDTRGGDWYTTCLCLNIAPSSNPINSISTG